MHKEKIVVFAVDRLPRQLYDAVKELIRTYGIKGEVFELPTNYPLWALIARDGMSTFIRERGIYDYKTSEFDAGMDLELFLESEPADQIAYRILNTYPNYSRGVDTILLDTGLVCKEEYKIAQGNL